MVWGGWFHNDLTPNIYTCHKSDKLWDSTTISIDSDSYSSIVFYFRKMGGSGSPGGNGGRAGCGGVSGYSGQTLIFAYQNRLNKKKESSPSVNRAQPGKRGKMGIVRDGYTATVKHTVTGKRISKGNFIVNYKIDSEFIVECDLKLVPPEYRSVESSGYKCVVSDKPSVRSKPIALYQLETEYLNFMNEQNSVLIHSSLMNRSFLTHIMNRESKYGQALLTF